MVSVGIDADREELVALLSTFISLSLTKWQNEFECLSLASLSN
jgi:hypothetical protein